MNLKINSFSVSPASSSPLFVGVESQIIPVAKSALAHVQTEKKPIHFSAKIIVLLGCTLILIYILAKMVQKRFFPPHDSLSSKPPQNGKGLSRSPRPPSNQKRGALNQQPRALDQKDVQALKDHVNENLIVIGKGAVSANLSLSDSDDE